MAMCCPPNRGCNAHGLDQPCVLEIFRAASGSMAEASMAIDRWDGFQRAEHGHGVGAGERRFRRRAYERARDEALTAVALDLAAEPAHAEFVVRRRRRRRRHRAPGPRGAGSHRGHGTPAGAVTA
jgi:hypothetical protein